MVKTESGTSYYANSDRQYRAGYPAGRILPPEPAIHMALAPLCGLEGPPR